MLIDIEIFIYFLCIFFDNLVKNKYICNFRFYLNKFLYKVIVNGLKILVRLVWCNRFLKL